MKSFRLIVFLVIMVPAFAALGAFATLDSGAHPLYGLFVGASVGIFFGLLFAGVNRRWVDGIYGPEREETE